MFNLYALSLTHPNRGDIYSLNIKNNKLMEDRDGNVGEQYTLELQSNG